MLFFKILSNATNRRMCGLQEIILFRKISYRKFLSRISDPDDPISTVMGKGMYQEICCRTRNIIPVLLQWYQCINREKYIYEQKTTGWRLVKVPMLTTVIVTRLRFIPHFLHIWISFPVSQVAWGYGVCGRKYGISSQKFPKEKIPFLRFLFEGKPRRVKFRAVQLVIEIKCTNFPLQRGEARSRRRLTHSLKVK